MERFSGAKEAADFLGIKVSTLYAWKSKGLIPCYKPTGPKGALMFRLTELQDFCRERKSD